MDQSLPTNSTDMSLDAMRRDELTSGDRAETERDCIGCKFAYLWRHRAHKARLASLVCCFSSRCEGSRDLWGSQTETSRMSTLQAHTELVNRNWSWLFIILIQVNSVHRMVNSRDGVEKSLDTRIWTRFLDD